MPPYKRTMVKYRIAVTAMPTYLFENLFTTLPSSSVSTLSMTRPVTKHITKDIRRDHVDMNMASCTQACGAPFLSVINSAYMRVVTKRIESIGANARVVFALLIAAKILYCSIGIAPPETSETVSIACTMKYTKKNWHVKFTTHCTVGDTGNVASGPAGASKVKME